MDYNELKKIEKIFKSTENVEETFMKKIKIINDDEKKLESQLISIIGDLKNIAQNLCPP